MFWFTGSRRQSNHGLARAIRFVLLGVVPLCSVGCVPDRVAVKPAFNGFDRVMLDATNDAQLLETIWLENFDHLVLKWPLVKAQFGLESLQNPRDVQRVRTEIGVKGIVYLDATQLDELGISVVDTENSAVVASVRVKARTKETDGRVTRTSRQELIEQAVRKLAAKAKAVRSGLGK